MKGRYKRRKGHFSVENPGKPCEKNVKCVTDGQKVVKKYLRLTRKQLVRTLSIPRGVRHFTANGDNGKITDTPMFLRPKKDYSNLEAVDPNPEKHEK